MQDCLSRVVVAGFEYKWETTDTTEKGTLIDDILVLDKMERCSYLVAQWTT